MRCALRCGSFRRSSTAMQARRTPFRDVGDAGYAGCGFFPAPEHVTRCLRPQHDLRSRCRFPNVVEQLGRHDPETVKLTGIYHNLIRHWAKV